MGFARRRGVACLGALALTALAAVGLPATPARGQVFLATRPGPEFEIGPLLLRADVSPDLGPVTVDVLWSLAVPGSRSALGLEQDLYLLWPRRVTSTAHCLDPGRNLGRELESRGFTILEHGCLQLAAQNLYPLKGRPSVETLPGGAPFVVFTREGLGTLGTTAGASYIRIPWDPRLANRTWLLQLRLVLPGLVVPIKRGWVEELLWGPRHRLSLSFNDVRDPVIFPFYLEHRDRAIAIASEPSQLLLSFRDASRLRVDEVFPPASSRRRGDTEPDTEVVSLFLDTSERRTPQELAVRFGYYSGLQAWAPILIPLAFFVLGRVAGPLVERLARRVGGTLAARLRLGRRGTAGAATARGVVLGPEVLARISPGQTTYDEVLQLCGRDVEEQEQLAAPERRRLTYRGRRQVPQGRRLFAWLVAVSHWDVESHEVAIEFEQGRVRDVQVRIRRSRLAAPEAW